MFTGREGEGVPWELKRGQFMARRGQTAFGDLRWEVWFDHGNKEHLPKCEMIGTWEQVRRLLEPLPKGKRIVERIDPVLGIVSEWVDEEENPDRGR